MKDIIKEDLDKALATPWGYCTCLIAQAMMRQGMDPTRNDPDVHGPSSIAEKYGAKGLMSAFDQAHADNIGQDGLTPQETLDAIRDMLPIELEAV